MLMLQKVRDREAITRQEVIELYQSYVQRDSQRAIHAKKGGEWTCTVVNKAPWEIEDQAMQWLRSNIGTIVLKGFLTVVPRFELDAQEQ